MLMEEYECCRQEVNTNKTIDVCVRDEMKHLEFEKSTTLKGCEKYTYLEVEMSSKN